MTNDNQLRAFAHFIVTDLVKSGKIGMAQGDNAFVLGANIVGLGENEAFPTREALIEKVTDAYVTWFGRAGGGLKAAS